MGLKFNNNSLKNDIKKKLNKIDDPQILVNINVYIDGMKTQEKIDRKCTANK